MAQVGKFNKLQVVKEVDFGVYLDGYHAALDAGLGHRGSEVIT